MNNSTCNWMPMAVDGVKDVVRFTCAKGGEPQVDLRTVVKAMRMSWKRWETCLIVVCSQRGWQIQTATDFQGQPTKLLAAANVSHLLAALASSSLPIYPCAKNRLTANAQAWEENWSKVAPPAALQAAVTHEEALDGVQVSPSALDSSNAITAKTEADVLKLTRKGFTPTEIARMLKLSRTTVSLLARGKYRFAKKLAPEVWTTPEAVPVVPTNETEKEDPMLLVNAGLKPETRAHFKLPRNPFVDDVQSPDDVYQTPSVRYVRAALTDCALHHGFIAVVGESGAGKSTLAEDLQERIRSEGRNILISKPYVLGMEGTDDRGKTLKSTQIAECIAKSIDPHVRVKLSSEARFLQLHQMLIASRKAGQRHLLVIEEAHCLPVATLKHLKRFLELKDGMQRLLGIALIGQPELRDRLGSQHAEVREVAQRCEIVELQPLDAELEGYLQHKFARFDLKLADVFTPDAFDAMRARLIYRPRGGKATDARSMCYPLVVNNLVCRAMNAAAAVHWPQVDAQVIAGC